MRTLEISIDEARAMTGLKLISAGEVMSGDGTTLQTPEARPEGAAHRGARDAGVKWFTSRGYHVYPYGVGVAGDFTLADLLAVRHDERRIVFVEILSDRGVSAELILRKQQLQAHGELCFILFRGEREFDNAATERLRLEIGSRADCLFYYLDGSCGNFLAGDSEASVAFHTTREEGIRVEATVTEKRNVREISIRYLTRLYANPYGVTISDTVPSDYSLAEEQFLWAFKQLCRKKGAIVKSTRARPYKTDYNAMRRKSGLKAFKGGELVGVLRIKSAHGLTRRGPKDFTNDVSADEAPYGVYELSNADEDFTETLFDVFREMRCQVELSS